MSKMVTFSVMVDRNFVTNYNDYQCHNNDTEEPALSLILST